MNPPADLEIRRLGVSDASAVADAAHLFDRTPHPLHTADFLASDGHHLFIAYLVDRSVGFVSGIETRHPDKGVEMLLYELGVDAAERRRGIGTALVLALRDLALDLGCRGMWVPIDAGDSIAAKTYQAAGADLAEPATILTWDLPRH